MLVPDDLRYSRTHEWVRLEGEIATVGITDHAQCELGDVVYVELPSIGKVLAEEDVFGAVESVKAVSDLYSPLPGEVVEVNEPLSGQTDLVNTDPYGAGWLIRLRVRDAGSVGRLLGPKEYVTFVQESEQ